MNNFFRLLISTSLIALIQFTLAAQNIGIGTSSPEGEFHISHENELVGPYFFGTGIDDMIVSFDSSIELSVDVEYTIFVVNAGPVPNLINIYFFDNLLYENLPMANSGIVVGHGIEIGFESLTGHTYDDYWQIYVNAGNEDQLIVKEDKVGIGTATPTATLDVNGDINFEGDLYKGGSIYPAMQSIDDLTDASSTINSVSLGKDAGANSIGIENVFVGVGAGASLSTGDNNLMIGYGASSFMSSGSGNIYMGNEVSAPSHENNTLRIHNDNSTTPLIYGHFQTNFVGINRTAQISPQEIFGIGKKNAAAFDYAGMYVHTEGASSTRPFYGFSINNKTTWITFNGGTDDIEIYNPFGNFKLLNNTATKPTGGSWASNSDKRLKKNIKSLNSNEMLEKLKLMQGVNYEWNDDKTDFQRPEGEQIGFIAQDLQQIWPEKVSTDGQGYLVTAYGDYDPVIVEAIKALAEKIEAQEKQIATLEEKLSEMVTWAKE